MEADLQEVLSRHVADCRYQDLPSDAVLATKRLILDTLAVGWAGSDADGLAPLRAGMLRAECRVDDGCDVWGTGRRCEPMAAAFLNSAAAASLEYDSLHTDGLIHSDIVCLPAVLAVAQAENSTGKEFLAAITLANDVACRLALAAASHTGWWHTSIYGVFGAAVGCAKLMGLDAARISDAIGIALSQAAGTQQPIVDRSSTKRLQSAMASRSGVFSALLARWGSSGPGGALEGTYGLYRMYEQGRSEAALQGLGLRFEGARSAIKKFPTCGCNHAVVEAALQLVHEYDLAPGNIEAATVRISPYMNRLVGGEYVPGPNPQVAAQFSARYGVACALVRRRVVLADLEAAAALDDTVVSFVRKVHIDVDEDNRGSLAPAEVELALVDGRRLRRRVEALPGSPESPLSAEEVSGKVHDCMRRGVAPLSASAIRVLIRTVTEIELLDDVTRLFAATDESRE